jgi:hypothetical protein
MLKNKKHTISQRMGRMERVLSQLYLTNVSMTERLDKLEKILFKEEKENE